MLEDAGAPIIARIKAFLARTSPEPGRGRADARRRCRRARARRSLRRERPVVTPESLSPARLATANLSEHLTRVAERLPDKPAVVCLKGAGSRLHATSRTFRDLDRAADRLAHAFAARGIGKGVRTILMVRPSFELFAVMFALLRTGAVPVMIDPGMGRQKLVDNLSSVEAEAYIGIPLAQALRVASPGRFPTVKTGVTVGRRLFWGGPTLLGLLESEPWRPFTPAPSRPDDMAAVFFTSGSTGPPKGVVYEHGMFDTMVGYLHTHFGYQEGDVDLATFPIFSLLDVGARHHLGHPRHGPDQAGQGRSRR